MSGVLWLVGQQRPVEGGALSWRQRMTRSVLVTCGEGHQGAVPPVALEAPSGVGRQLRQERIVRPGTFEGISNRLHVDGVEEQAGRSDSLGDRRTLRPDDRFVMI